MTSLVVIVAHVIREKTMRILNILIKNIFNITKTNLFKSASSYGFYSFLNGAIPFLLLPVMTRYLSPNDYGYITMFRVLFSLCLPFIGLNAILSYNRAFFLDQYDKGVYMGNVFLLVAMSSLICIPIIIFFRNAIEMAFGFPSSWLWSVIVTAISTIVVQCALFSWQVREQPKQYGVYLNSFTLLEAITGIIFVVGFKMGWEGRIISRTLVTVCFACFGLAILIYKRWVKFRVDRYYILHSLRYGIPLLPHSLIEILNTTIDKILISRMISMSDMGVYSAGYQMGTIINFIATAYNQAYYPWLYRKLGKNSKNDKNLIVKTTYIYFVLIFLVVFLFSLLSPLLVKVFLGKQFQGAAIFAIWISIGCGFRAQYLVLMNYIYYSEKTYIVSIITTIGMFVNMSLSYFLINKNGAIGAAQASAVMHFIILIITWVISMKVYPMPWFKIRS
jgi:O-antigen/teichoic acid export membrane protein